MNNITLNYLIKKNKLNANRSSGTDKVRRHSYIDVYESLFASKRNENLTILEIGTHFGGSALLWHDYFPKSNLVLIDIMDRTLDQHMKQMNPNRYKKIISNAYSQEVVSQIKIDYPNGLDIAIDDGPHTPQSQKDFIQLYLPMMRKNGILVIEDISKIEYAHELKKITSENYISEIIDLRHVKNRYDDIMLIVKS